MSVRLPEPITVYDATLGKVIVLAVVPSLKVWATSPMLTVSVLPAVRGVADVAARVTSNAADVSRSASVPRAVTEPPTKVTGPVKTLCAVLVERIAKLVALAPPLPEMNTPVFVVPAESPDPSWTLTPRLTTVPPTPAAAVDPARLTPRFVIVPEVTPSPFARALTVKPSRFVIGFAPASVPAPTATPLPVLIVPVYPAPVLSEMPIPRNAVTGAADPESVGFTRIELIAVTDAPPGFQLSLTNSELIVPVSVDVFVPST